MPTTGETLHQLIGRFDEFDRKMDERQAQLVRELAAHDTRLDLLEGAPQRHRDRIHTYIVSLFCGSFAGVGAMLAAHFKAG